MTEVTMRPNPAWGSLGVWVLESRGPGAPQMPLLPSWEALDKGQACVAVCEAKESKSRSAGGGKN